MKAAVVHDFSSPLVVADVPIPEPGAEQVLVRIEASGLCHTDIHAARGEWPVKPSPPFIPGHEGVGVIERVGSGNPHGLVEGMRVALPWLGYACGDCACSSDLVAVFGAGGLGHLAIQYARITGASVVAVDLNADRLETAWALGAEHVVHAGEQDPVAAIKALGGASAAISTAVNPIAFEQALGSLRRGGTLVCVGLPADNAMQLPIFETVLNGLTVRGSIVGTHHDLEEVFALHQRGLTKIFHAEVALDDVNAAIEQVLDGSAPSPRLVFDVAGRVADTPAAVGSAVA
jgi:propanol-preferring alcohol dehydrogenase